MEENKGELEKGKEGEQKILEAQAIAEALNKARSEERSKLMTKMEGLKTTIEENKKTINDLKQTIESLKKEKEALEKEKTNYDSKLEEKLQEGKKLMDEELQKALKERDEATQRAEKAEKALEDYKAKVELDKYLNDKVSDLDEDFRDLVRGNTKEEIDESYNLIKEKQEKISQKFVKKDKPPRPEPKKLNKGGKIGVEDIANMSLEEYIKWKKDKDK